MQRTLWLIPVVSALLAGPAGGQTVVSNAYENLDAARGLKGVPVTFSRIGAGGDFTKGITPSIGGSKLPAQVNVLRKAPDASIRHALVSFVLPALAAGGKVKIDWLNEAPPPAPAFEWGFDRARFDLKLRLTPAKGTALTSDLGAKPPVQPDHAHTPSLGYVSYLITGDKFYAEEASFWAAYQGGEWPHKGLNWGGMNRSFAFSLRMVVDAAFILPDDHPLRPYFTKIVEKCLNEMTAQLVGSGRRVHSPPHTNFRSSGRPRWVNAKHCSVWQYGWAVWSLANAADKGFAKAGAVRDWAARYIVGFYASDDEFKGPDGKTYRYDPRDAVAYSTATELVKTQLVPGPNGTRLIKVVGPGKVLRNYGEIWYYTKLNVDNSWHDNTGVTTRPDADGNWPLRPDGWGGGMTWNAFRSRRERWWGWHRYGAWAALVTALDAGVPKAQQAWKTMTHLADKKATYGYEMVPRQTANSPEKPK